MSSNTLTKVLTRVGLEEKEITLYLACLKSTKNTPTSLSRQTKMRRSVVYFYVEKLLQRGLLAKEVHGKKNSIVAIPPQKAWNAYLEGQRKKTQEISSALKNIIPQLESQQKDHTESTPSAVQILYGPEGLHYALGLSTKLQEPLHSMGSFKFILETIGEKEMFRKYTVKRIENGNALYNIREKAFGEHKNFSESLGGMRKNKLIDFPLDLHANISFSNDKVAIVTMEDDIIKTTLLIDPPFAHLLHVFFDILWDRLEDE